VVAAFEKYVVGALTDLKSNVQELLCRVKSNQIAERLISFSDVPFALPITTKIDLDALEEWIRNLENRNLLVCFYFKIFL